MLYGFLFLVPFIGINTLAAGKRHHLRDGAAVAAYLHCLRRLRQMVRQRENRQAAIEYFALAYHPQKEQEGQPHKRGDEDQQPNKDENNKILQPAAAL